MNINIYFVEAKPFIKKDLLFLVKDIQKGYLGNSCVVVGYIRIYESARKNRLRWGGAYIQQDYQAVRYMDISTHGSVPYLYRSIYIRVHTYSCMTPL